MAKKIKLTNKDDDFKGSGKDEIISARGGDDSVSGGGGNDTINGGAGNDSLKGGSGDDTLNGGEGNDILLGGTGDDTLNGGAGDNTVNGGDGDDTVVLDGNFADAKISEDGNGGWIITTAGGTTKISNVELFRFADGTKTEDELIVVPPGTGKTFVLTNNVDGPGAVAPAIDTNGTVGDDTYIGATGTLTSAEVIDGKDGKDTVTFRDSAATNLAPKLSNVETVAVTALGGGAGTTFQLTGSTGVTTLKNDGSTSNLTFTGVAAIAAVELANVTAGTTTITYNAAAVAGAADAQTLKISNSTSGDINVSGVETLTVTSDGKNNATDIISGAATVKFEGAGSLAVATAAGTAVVLNDATTIDGSKATGALTFAIDGTKSVTATGGTADDIIGVSGLEVADKLDGGAGKDTLQFTAGGDLPAVKISAANFEGIQVTSATVATAINLDNFTGSAAIVDFKLGLNAADNNGVTAAVTITNGLTGSTITEYADAGVDGSVSFALKTDGAADALTYNLLNTDTGGTVTTQGLTTLAAAGIEDLKLNLANATIAGSTVDAGDTLRIGTLTAAAATKLTITGNNNVIIGDVASTLSAATTIDASAVTKNVQLGGLAGGAEFVVSSTGASITTGVGDDSVHLTTGATAVLGALDLGTQSATGAGDTLILKSIAGVVGQTVIDLNQADQVAQVSGLANAAVQKGIENVDLSGMFTGNTAVITGSAGANTINGTVGVDTINAGGGNDTVVGTAGGQDLVDLGTGDDTFQFSGAFATGNTNADTVTNFTFGAASADKFDIGFTVQNGTTAATSNLVAIAPVAVASDGTATANDVIFTFSGAGDKLAAGTTVTNAVARAVTALTSGADFDAANVAAGDSFVLVLDDGTNSFVYHYVFDGAANTTAADLELIAQVNGQLANQVVVGDFI